MIPLLVADLQAMGNLVRKGPGRRTLLGGLAVLALLAILSLALGSTVLRSPEMRGLLLGTYQGIGGGSGPTGGIDTNPGGGSGTLLAMALGPSLALALWYGLSAGHRLLFETPEVQLCGNAPMPPQLLVAHAAIRAWWLGGLHGLALSGPATALMLNWLGADWTSYAALPVAVFLCMAPVLVIALLSHLLLARFFSGRGMQVVLAAMMGVLSLGISGLLVATAFLDSEDLRGLAGQVNEGLEPPLFAAGGAALLLATVEPVWDHGALLRTVGALVAALLFLMLAADLHPRAVECNQAARSRKGAKGGPLAKGSGASRLQGDRQGSKPVGIGRAIAIKELCAFREQPRAALGLLLSTGMLWWLSREGGLSRTVERGAAQWPEFAGVTVMLGLSLLGLLLLLPAQTPRLVLADARSWNLYANAPVGPWALLRGKLAILGGIAFWPFLVAATLGITVIGVPKASVPWFLGVGVCVAATATGAIAAVGTWPRLVKGDIQDRTNLGLRALFTALLSIAALDLLALPLTLPWAWVAVTNATYGTNSTAAEQAGQTDPMITLAWLTLAETLLIGGGGLLLARWNLARLLRPV